MIGRRGIAGFEDLKTPRIRTIGALTLTPASQGNAIGVGLADFITQALRAAINEHKTFINTLTTGDMDRAKIPATLADDETLIRTIEERYGSHRWMFIPNTLHLGELYVSEDLVPEIGANPVCRIGEKPTILPYQHGRQQLSFANL